MTAASPVEVLVSEARQAMQSAYAPYSGFRVGAALRSAKGGVYSGCNVENVSFPIGVCAERNAIAAAVRAEGPDFSLEAIAVVASSGAGDLVPLTPCGACRQAILEFGERARVVRVDAAGGATEIAIGELLPDAFSFEPG